MNRSLISYLWHLVRRASCREGVQIHWKQIDIVYFPSLLPRSFTNHERAHVDTDSLLAVRRFDSISIEFHRISFSFSFSSDRAERCRFSSGIPSPRWTSWTQWIAEKHFVVRNVWFRSLTFAMTTNVRSIFNRIRRISPVFSLWMVIWNKLTPPNREEIKSCSFFY